MGLVSDEGRDGVLLAPGAVRVDAQLGVGTEGGTDGAEPLAVGSDVSSDLHLDGGEAAVEGGRDIPSKGIGGVGSQERVRWDGATGRRRKSGPLGEPARKGHSTRSREQVCEGGLDSDIGTSDPLPERQRPRLVRRPAHDRAGKLGHACRKGAHAQTLGGQRSALAQADGAIGCLDTHDQTLASRQFAGAGHKGVTQGDAPGPPAHVGDGAGGDHGRRGNLAMSE